MRWLFIFVLLLNLAYIAWEVSRPAVDSSYANIKSAKNVQTIVLLSEVNQQQIGMQRNQHGDTVNKVGADEQGGSLQADLKQSSAGQTATEAGGSEKTGAGRHESKSAVETASKAQQALPAQARKKTNGCYTVGPFRELAVLRRLTRELKPYVGTVDFRGREEKEPPLYWVYIKPEKSREAAIATGNQLKANKINDYFIIRQGKNINGVSLGYFRNKKGATRLVKRVNKLGYDVVLEPVFKTYTVYWLDYQLADGVEVPDSIFDKYIKTSKKDRIKRLSRECAE